MIYYVTSHKVEKEKFMNEKAALMKREIRAVANYRALMISKWFLSFALLFAALYLGIRRFPVSPLYILLFLIILPPIIAFGLKDYGKKTNNKILLDIIMDNPFLLETLKAKYKYTKLHYISNSVSYLISFFLIGLWQYVYSQQYYLSAYLRSLPIMLIVTGIIIRLLGIWFYQLKIRYDISHNKVY